MNRRSFTRAAASAVIATAARPILGANDRVNVGIVGIGGRGNDHIQFYSALKDDCRIAAVCDVNQAGRERGSAAVKKLGGAAPTEFADMRRLFESKDVDAVSITTPNHWHALAAIWACQAGKDVYVEKPASHNIFEGAQLVHAARKYNRMVQVGSQSRSIAHKRKAIQLLSEGVIGSVYHARGLCFRRRFSIGVSPDEPVPPGLDWPFFLGPAQIKPYSKNKFAYNWHWFWDTGNGDIGNQGVHEMDVALWGLGRTAWPLSVSSSGAKLVWKDDQETPNTQSSTFDFGDALLTFDVRNLPTPPEGLAPLTGPNYTGNIFFGSLGYMTLDPRGYKVYKSTAGNISGDEARGAGAGQREKYELALEGKPAEGRDWETQGHMQNFLEAIRKRDHTLLHAEAAVGVRAAAFCHLANISCRLNRTLRLAPATGRFLSDDEANSMLSRDYRAPYVVPEIAPPVV